MQIAPELQLVLLNAIVLAVAYLGIYPGLQEKTLGKIMVIDTAMTALALLVAASWFMGTGAGFSLIVFETNWLIFTLVTLFVMEIPAFLWFARKYGLPLGPPDDGNGPGHG